MKNLRSATTITSSFPGPPERRMQLVPLSTDGRVTVVVTAPLPLGPLRVALRLHDEDIVIETLGPIGARVGRFGAADAAAYRPVLEQLAERGRVGTCPARMVHTGETRALILHLGSPATCVPRRAPERAPSPPAPLATARTTRVRAVVPAVCAALPHRSFPPRPSTLPRPRVPATAIPVQPAQAEPRRLPPPARPPARFGQPDDTAPRLTRPQRRRVLWATLCVAAALVLAVALQHGVSADAAAVCAGGSSSCESAQP
jgi:hypothetical protein